MSAEAWKVPVAAADIPETGRHVDLIADAPAREALARLAGVPDIPRLEAEFELTKHGRDGVRVVGHLSATVEQNCVLTLEPLENKVEEDIDLLFAPAPDAPPDAEKTVARARGEEPPEPLRDGIVDLGAVISEFLLLGIDPYPRKPGSVFDAPKPKEGQADHPFAALAALKKGNDRKDD